MLCASRLVESLIGSAVMVPRNDLRDELEVRQGRGESMTINFVGDSSMVAFRTSPASRRIGLLGNVRNPSGQSTRWPAPAHATTGHRHNPFAARLPFG